MSKAVLRHDRLNFATAELRSEILAKFARWNGPGETTALPWLTFYTRTKTTSSQCYVYEPSLAVILQGRKQVTVGDELFVYDESRFLLTSVDMPVASSIIEASDAQPYMSMRIKLDLAKIRQLILDYDIQAPKVAPLTRGIATGPVTVELLSAFSRLFDLLDRPRDLPVLSALIYQEILYHLLRSELGDRLWQLAMSGSQSNRIQKVIHWLRHHYTEPLRVDALAKMAAMSVSSMHHHFRELTSMSPLQFQKQLRLQEARRLLLVEDLDAGMAAFRVGYESASQFSREYSRLFGQPPMRDIKILRASTERLDGDSEGSGEGSGQPSPMPATAGMRNG